MGPDKLDPSPDAILAPAPGGLRYRRMPIEAESPEQLGYGRIGFNLAESSVSDAPLRELGPDLLDKLGRLVLQYGDHRGLPAHPAQPAHPVRPAGAPGSASRRTRPSRRTRFGQPAHPVRPAHPGRRTRAG